MTNIIVGLIALILSVSILLRIRYFSESGLLRSLLISCVVYLSFFASVFIVSPEELQKISTNTSRDIINSSAFTKFLAEFLGSLVGELSKSAVVFIVASFIIFFTMVILFAAIRLLIEIAFSILLTSKNANYERIKQLGTTFVGLFLFSVSTSQYWSLSAFASLAFIVVSIAIINSVLGIITFGVTVSLVLAQFLQKEAINSFWLLSVVDVIPSTNPIIVLIVVLISNFIGAYELYTAKFSTGDGIDIN